MLQNLFHQTVIMDGKALERTCNVDLISIIIFMLQNATACIRNFCPGISDLMFWLGGTRRCNQIIKKIVVKVVHLGDDV